MRGWKHAAAGLRLWIFSVANQWLKTMKLYSRLASDHFCIRSEKPKYSYLGTWNILGNLELR